MSTIGDIFKNIVSWFVDLSVNERISNYRSSFFRYQDMMTQITIETDKAMMTFSIAALAALAALNDAVFRPYGRLSFATLACFVLLAVTVMVGYYVSKALVQDAQRIVSANFQKSLTTPLGQGLQKVKFRTLSKWINRISVTLFICGMVCFIALMGLYIKEL